MNTKSTECNSGVILKMNGIKISVYLICKYFDQNRVTPLPSVQYRSFYQRHSRFCTHQGRFVLFFCGQEAVSSRVKCLRY